MPARFLHLAPNLRTAPFWDITRRLVVIPYPLFGTN